MQTPLTAARCSTGKPDVVVVLAPPDSAAVDPQPAGDEVGSPLGEGIDGVRGVGVQNGASDAGEVARIDQAGEYKLCCMTGARHQRACCSLFAGRGWPYRPSSPFDGGRQ